MIKLPSRIRERRTKKYESEKQMILVSDYDGTLKQKDISNEDIQAINTFRAQGHLFGIATGRALKFLTDDLVNYDVKRDFLLGTNGGVILFEEEDNVSYLSQIRPKLIRKIFAIVSRFEDAVFYISDGFQYAIPKVIQDSAKVEETHEIPEQSYNSACIKGPSLDVNKRIYDVLRRQNISELDFYYNTYDVGIVDVVSKGVSKSSTIHKVFIEELGYHKEDIYTIGNSLNDMEMIRDFNGFAVTDSDPQIIPLATALFPNIADCIAHLLSSS
ncbi:MAG: HAD family hydrolase [Chloroflexota bacterium]|jgi:hypothetical protein|nr:HAD family hydrolase [Chloroflexota bacterium]